MIRREKDGVPYYVFEAFTHQHGIVHAVFTRIGGTSRPPYQALNVGRSVGDEPQAVNENHRLAYRVLAVSDAEVVTAWQVHGNHVAAVGASDRGTVVPETDALITDQPGVTLMLRFADCLPIFLYDRAKQIIGLGHAGWRGTSAKVAPQMVSAMVEHYGTDPADLVAGLGPAIGPCCYVVGEDVTQAVKATLHEYQDAIRRGEDGELYVDLWEANRQQLLDRGVREIEIGGICTSCHAGEFFSHRADGGKTGRFAAFMGIREPA
jgi:YfiH family protein